MVAKVTTKRGFLRQEFLCEMGDGYAFSIYITDEMYEDREVMFKCLAGFMEECVNGKEE